MNKAEIRRDVFSLYRPLLFQRLIIYLINTFAILMLGKMSGVYMASSSFANQVFIIVSLTVAGIAEGSSVMLSQFWGKKDVSSAEKIISCTYFNAIIFGGFISLLTVCFPELLMRIFTDDAEMIRYGSEYLQIVGVSYFFYSVSTVTFSILRSLKVIKISVIASVIACIINVGLTTLFIFGPLANLNLGVRGAALASLCSRVVEFIIIVGYAYFFEKSIDFKKIKLFRVDKQYLSTYYKTLMPLLSNELLWGIGDAIIVMVYGRLGEDFATAQSTYSVFSQFSAIAMSMNVAASILVGNAIGRKAQEEVDYLVSFFRKAAFVAGCFAASIMLLGIFLVPVFYDFSTTVNTYVSQIFIAAMIIDLFKAMQGMNMMGLLRGGGDVKFILFNDMIFLWLWAIPVCYLSAMVFHLPVYLIFFLTRADQIWKYFTSEYRIRSNQWVNYLTERF